ncbi:hypothetical protein FZC78_21305 [Rossellomorea vietnamensis]|uniref:Helix-turn-helix domain-containing protein n=1 Tax=Rossellomorea vietnamensis TaxID=218284 RepID=A0A5D4NIB7_9BACI|nr:hypothetical protein [Rossellomorea vietnamensis]TYS13504.1 hypothetical protein FZC78_21305 [Rossellomorea vietnamensis]
MKNDLISLSIFSLAIAIVIGSWFISNGLSNSGVHTDAEEVQQEQLLTQSELGEYLGLTEEEIKMFISEDISKSMIPYIKVGNEFYFSVKAIDKWLVETGSLKVGQ